ncbi:hypothetical protein KAI46_07585, partial [bacterium]|nr:hypothetical protein [bacterium]
CSTFAKFWTEKRRRYPIALIIRSFEKNKLIKLLILVSSSVWKQYSLTDHAPLLALRTKVDILAGYAQDFSCKVSFMSGASSTAMPISLRISKIDLRRILLARNP